MRIGLFGGTFNPIHLGHLRSAEEIREAFSLDCIFFVPAANPPHKHGSDLAAATDRLTMVELAIAGNPFLSASAVELERTGTSYSVDTIRYFLTTLQPSNLFFIIGLDAFLELHTWKDYVLIPELCDLIVTSRPGISPPSPEQFIPVALRTSFWYDPTVRVYRHSSGHILVSHNIAGLHISASTIRDKVRRNESVRYLVPSEVEVYMREHALYQQEGLSR